MFLFRSEINLLRSCWRQYRFRVEMQRLRKLNLTVESIDGEISVPNEKEQCILESGMEPIFEPELGMGQNKTELFDGT